MSAYGLGPGGGLPARAKIPVLLAAGSAPWETALVTANEQNSWLIHKRCLDVADLLASAATQSARAAVVSGHLAGLDADALARMARAGVVCVAVADGDAEQERLLTLGATATIGSAELGRLGEVLGREVALASLDKGDTQGPKTVDPASIPDDLTSLGGRVPGGLVSVWGPHGAPGRTTVSLGLATAWARGGARVLVIDADPYGGTVAHHLGLVDRSSGLLALLRAANSGTLSTAMLAAHTARVRSGLAVLVGLPRVDRWREMRPASLARVLHVAREVADVVIVDTGAGLTPAAHVDIESHLTRDGIVTEVLADSDQIIAVGSAEPTSLARLTRALSDVTEAGLPRPAHLVVNRMRPSLGWAHSDVQQLLSAVAPAVPVHFLPYDQRHVDEAMMAGRAVGEMRRGPLAKAFQTVSSKVSPPIVKATITSSSGT